MKRVKSSVKVILGTILIAVAINVFFIKYNLLPTGFLGVSTLLTIKLDMNIWESLLFINLIMIILGFLTLPNSEVKKTIIASLLVPIFTYILKDVVNYINIEGSDIILIAVFGGVLIGYGSSLIYKENLYAGPNDIVDMISKAIIGPNGYIINYIFDGLLLILVGVLFNLETAMYSLLSMIIIEYITKKSVIGISESKVFYIITKKEKAVKRFILKDLHYDITVFEVKGGYTQSESKILMSVIPTKDYYKLREGIKEIDSNAFISITDSYEIINNNKTINKKYDK